MADTVLIVDDEEPVRRTFQEWLASAGDDQRVLLWDRAGRPTPLLERAGVFRDMAFSPDGTRLAAGCDDNTVRLLDVASREQVAELRGHTDYVHAIDWSPDGTRLVSGSGDFTVRVWDALSPAVRAKRAEGP